jgi:hypothetical protein
MGWAPVWSIWCLKQELMGVDSLASSEPPRGLDGVATGSGHSIKGALKSDHLSICHSANRSLTHEQVPQPSTCRLVYASILIGEKDSIGFRAVNAIYVAEQWAIMDPAR